MRCKCCNKILTTQEIVCDNTKDDGMCFVCIASSFNHYNILTDKEYVCGDMDCIDGVELGRSGDE